MKVFVWLVLVLATLEMGNTLAENEYGLCVQTRFEGNLLIEWIEYHALIGFSNFYLYIYPFDLMFPEEKAVMNDIIRPYISPTKTEKNARLELGIPLPHVKIMFQNQSAVSHAHRQGMSMQDCFNRFSSENEWLGFFDVDEFFVPNNLLVPTMPEENLYKGIIKQVIEKSDYFSNVDAIAITWTLMGPSHPYNKIDQARPNDSLLTSVVTQQVDISKGHYDEIYPRYKILVHTRNDNRLQKYCDFSCEKPNSWSHNCFCEKPILKKNKMVFSREKHLHTTVVDAQAHRYNSAMRSSVGNVPDADATSSFYLLHYYWKTCHENYYSDTPRRRFKLSERFKNVQNIPKWVRYRISNDTCEDISTKSIPEPMSFLERITPMLQRLVNLHPAWGKNMTISLP